MNKLKILFIALIALLVVTVPVTGFDDGPERIGNRPDAPPYALHGPYWVGTMEMTIEPDSEQPLPLTVWYPAQNHDGLAEDIVYPTGVTGHALADAEPDASGGPYPLVVFSHGLGTDRSFSVFLMEHIATYGFVVMAPNHPSTSTGFWMDDEAEIPYKIMTSFFDRPLEVSQVIDFAETLTASGGDMEGLIDTEWIAVAGHSMGGHSVFAATGARMQFDNAAIDACHAGENPDSACWVSDSEPLLAERRDGAPQPGELWSDYGHDARIDAGIAFAPWTIAISEVGFTGVEVPMLVVAGSADYETLPEYNAAIAYEHISSEQKALAIFENASHGIYNETCEALPEDLRLPFYELCADEVWDKDRTHDLINHLSVAWLLETLTGDTEAHAALMPENVTFVGIEYQAAME